MRSTVSVGEAFYRIRGDDWDGFERARLKYV